MDKYIFIHWRNKKECKLNLSNQNLINMCKLQLLNYWYKHDQITPSDILTSIIAPLIFFIAGLGIGWIKDYKKRRKEKKDEELLKRIVIDWLNKIKARLEGQELNLQRIIDGYKKGESKILQDYEIIPIDRLLSLSDVELRKVINIEDYYISIVSDLSFVRVTQEYLKTMFEDWSKQTFEIDKQRKDLNLKGFEITSRLCSVNTPVDFGNGLYLAWSKITNNKNKEDIIGLKSKDFYNEFLMTFYKNVKVNILDCHPEKLHAYVERFLEFIEEYKIFVDDIELGKLNYVDNLIYQKSQFNNMSNNIGNFLKAVK